MRLSELLGLDWDINNTVWLAGAGGKTTLLYLLAQEATAQGLRTVATTTTHIARPEPTEWLVPVVLEREVGTIDELAILHERLNRIFAAGHVAVCGVASGEDKLCKIGDEAVLREVVSWCDVMITEADGSKCLPLKLPNDTEPVIMPDGGRVMVVMGLSAVGRPLVDCCHRYALVQERLGLAQEATATPENIAQILWAGYAKWRPHFLLNQADGAEERQAGRELAARLLGLGAERVDILSMQHKTFESKGDTVCWC